MSRTVLFKGNPMHLVGPALTVGQPVPDVTCTKVDFSPVAASSLLGKVVLVSVTPSVDTPVCDLQAKRFNEAAAALGAGVVVANVSLDLPPALKRWCSANGADNLVAVSDYRDRAFGTAWGVLIDELKLLARAVFVVDREGHLAYQEIVPEVTNHPDYDAALAAVQRLV
ncbi:MAG: thiol peroxidase [Fimbriimonadaceae bacterium]|nr:thiol peroxidase [Fimbriimonadaceae bacterium]